MYTRSTGPHPKVYLRREALFFFRPSCDFRLSANKKTSKREGKRETSKRTDTDSSMVVSLFKGWLTSHGRVVDNLSGLDGSPLVSLDPHTDGEQTGRKSKSLHTHLLAVVHLGLGGPVQEFDNVLGHLGGGGGSAVFVFDQAVKEDTSHSNTYQRLVADLNLECEYTYRYRGSRG